MFNIVQVAIKSTSLGTETKTTSGKNLRRTNQGFKFLKGSFCKRDNRRERQSQHPKGLSFIKYRLIHFRINSKAVIVSINWKSWVFQALKSTSHFLFQSTVSCRSDSNSGAKTGWCYKLDAWSHLVKRVVSWA